MEDTNRVGRHIAAGLFIVGGIFTGLLLVVLQGFARSQAGMSAGPVPGAPNREAAIIPLICCYFAVSIFGVLSTNEKSRLKKFAFAAHVPLLIAYGIICSEATEGKIVSSMATLAAIMGVYFLPGVIIWSEVLAKASEPPKPPPSENLPPQSQEN